MKEDFSIENCFLKFTKNVTDVKYRRWFLAFRFPSEKCSNNFSSLLYRLSHFLGNFEGKVYLFGIMCFSLDGSEELILTEVFYYNSFVFGSAGFDPKFFAAR